MAHVPQLSSRPLISTIIHDASNAVAVTRVTNEPLVFAAPDVTCVPVLLPEASVAPSTPPVRPSSTVNPPDIRLAQRNGQRRRGEHQRVAARHRARIGER